MSLLKTAVDASIPIIGVYTKDTVNLPWILNTVLGPNRAVKIPPNTDPSKAASAFKVVYTNGEAQVNEDIYRAMMKANRVLLLINPEPNPLIFDAGPVPVPKVLQHSVLSQVVEDESLITALMPSVSGMNLKDITEALAITMARDHVLTPKGLMATRGIIVGKTRGLQLVDTHQDIYMPDEQLDAWLELNRTFFLDPSVDYRLVPRGLLLEGPPGVGKTQGAKWIARKLDLPLYRLEITAALDKYVGGSEANVDRVLEIIDQEAPCVALLDEVEKLFTEQNDRGVTRHLLSQYLWWMQEHPSRVLTVMTTNNKEAIPPELYREGRIDMIFSLDKLNRVDAFNLAKQVVNSFKLGDKLTKEAIKESTALLNLLYENPAISSVGLPHSNITNNIITIVKGVITKTKPC